MAENRNLQKTAKGRGFGITAPSNKTAPQNAKENRAGIRRGLGSREWFELFSATQVTDNMMTQPGTRPQGRRPWFEVRLAVFNRAAKDSMSPNFIR
tara:strand:- start:132 stop:419 length:288 start_codon:yes stop_codon:yes gene_type:complete